MSKEFRIPFDKLGNSQTITDIQEKAFKEHDLDMHKNEVDELIDDHSKKERVYKVRNRKYFDMGKGK
mgnify:FL=1